MYLLGGPDLTHNREVPYGKMCLEIRPAVLRHQTCRELLSLLL